MDHAVLAAFSPDTTILLLSLFAFIVIAGLAGGVSGYRLFCHRQNHSPASAVMCSGCAWPWRYSGD